LVSLAKQGNGAYGSLVSNVSPFLVFRVAMAAKDVDVFGKGEAPRLTP
jgi:hypothetical protein